MLCLQDVGGLVKKALVNTQPSELPRKASSGQHCAFVIVFGRDEIG